MGNPTVERVRALQARAARMRAEGRDPASAFEQMLGDEAASGLERAGRLRDQLHDAERRGYIGVGAMYNPQQKG
jgi:hypothetical protein